MKKFKGFGTRRRSFELPTLQASPGDFQTQDAQVPKPKKISRVVGIDSPPVASSLRREEHQGIKASAAKESEETNAKQWKKPLHGKTLSRGSSLSSTSDIHLCSSSSRLSDASLATTTGNNNNNNVWDGDGDAGRAIVVAFDANARDAVVSAVAWAFQHVLRAGDLLALLGVMDFLRGPLGYKCQVNDHTWLGANAKHLHEELALKKLAWSATPGLQTLCTQRGVKLVVTVKAAARPEGVILQDAEELGAVHVVLDRSLKTHIPRKRKCYLQRLRCDVTRMRRGGGVDILLRSNVPSPSTPQTASSARKADDDDGEEELFTIDHCVATMPTHPHQNRHGHGDSDEEGYESDDLFSICDVVDGPWRPSSFAAARLMLHPGGPESSARNSMVAAHDHDPAMACFVPPRTSVESGPRLDSHLLSLRLQLRD